MSERPELPTFFARGLSVYDVVPDSKPMTWSIWDSEGWIGDIVLGGVRLPDVPLSGAWSSADHEGRATGPHDTWQAAVVGLLGGV